ncbi:hypothetical protein MOQ_000656 [Trypanosoma cruzi marinkellei]|uniref:Sodium stibogluconate resistance protein n=1 Tax=Trypanosoma cruzi marinkellei TaxID=85056 RepID=K2NMZ9_TRYCR|nr:hypothetical protein MOQ_000656 [Trypanosoma cruzi marinkellei]
MGNGASVEENRHSQLFQQGYRSLQEGRYTYAEIYYDQAIERHEGHPFWIRLDDLIEWERRGKVGQKGTDAKMKQTNRDGGQEEAAFPEVKKDSLKDENEVNIEMGDAAGVGGSGKIEIPLDSRLAEVVDYLVLRADIADSYMAAGRYEEATPHMDFISSHTRVMLKFLQIARMTKAEESADSPNPLEGSTAEGGGNHAGGGNRRAHQGFMMVSDMERESIIDCFEQFLRMHWVSSMANSVYIVSERFKKGKSEKKHKKELDTAVVTCAKIQEELYNVAKRRARSLSNSVVLSFLESVMEELDAESSTTSITNERVSTAKGKTRTNTLFEDQGNKSTGNRSLNELEMLVERDECPIKVQLQMVYDRRSLCREVPAPQQAPTLRYITWIDDEIRRVVPGTNYNLEIQCGMVDEKRKKQLQKRSLKFATQRNCNYNDRVLLGKSFDEENALLLFPVFLIQADVQFELGAATKGINALDIVDKLSTQLYGVESLERHSIMRSVMESRKRGGSLFMMFED